MFNSATVQDSNNTLLLTLLCTASDLLDQLTLAKPTSYKISIPLLCGQQTTDIIAIQHLFTQTVTDCWLPNVQRQRLASNILLGSWHVKMKFQAMIYFYSQLVVGDRINNPSHFKDPGCVLQIFKVTSPNSCYWAIQYSNIL